MSLIAKSLKRLENHKNNRNSSGFFKKINSRNFIVGDFTIYAAFAALTLLLFFLYYYKTNEMIEKQISPIDFSAIERLSQDIKKSEKELLIKKQTNKQDCEYLLEIGNLEKMYKLAKKQNNLKYISIYYVKKGDTLKAINGLRDYLKDHPNDEEAIAYLAYALVNDKKYIKALNELNKIKSNRYELFFDKAVVFELMGDINDAMKYYSKALKKTQDPVLKNMIKAKMVVLRFVGE